MKLESQRSFLEHKTKMETSEGKTKIKLGTGC